MFGIESKWHRTELNGRMTKENDAVHRMYGQQKIQQQDDDYTSLKKKKNENK